MKESRPRFRLGKLVMTLGAIDALAKSGEVPLPFLARHVHGDWGEVCPADKKANERALRTGARILSAYETAAGARLWIITEADRSSTCLLLPEEY